MGAVTLNESYLVEQQSDNLLEAQLRVARAKDQGKEAYVYEIRAWHHDIAYVLPFDHVFEFDHMITDPYTQLGFPCASNWELRLLDSTD